MKQRKNNDRQQVRRRFRRSTGIWVFALLAVLSHTALFLVVRGRDTEPAPEPSLTGKFLKRPPLREQVLQRRMSLPAPARPLWRAPPAPATYARATVSASRQMASARILSAPVSLSLPRRPFASGFGVRGSESLRSDLAAVTVSSPADLDLGLELLDAEAMDTGRYRALVIEDPGNPLALKGFVRLAAVGIRSAMEVAEGKWDNNPAWTQDIDNILPEIDWRHSTNIRALRELALELESQTQLRAAMDEDGLLHETDWMESPFVLLTSPGEFIPTPPEIANLGRYLTGGGFAYVEVVGLHSQEDLILGRIRDLPSLRGLVEDALVQQGLHRGTDWEIAPLPLTHPLFSSYHAIQVLPQPYWSVVGAVVLNAFASYQAGPSSYGWHNQEPAFLEGIYVQGRLAGIYSQQDYRDLWSRRIERAFEGRSGDDYNAVINNRTTGAAALRLGVNIVVYALTQEGGLARQLVAR